MKIIKTLKSWIVKFSGGMKTISSSHPFAPVVADLIGKDAPENEVLSYMDVAEGIKLHSGGKFHIDENGIVYINKEKLPASLSKRLLNAADINLTDQLGMLMKFWDNVQNNPDPRAKSDLFDFLNFNGLPITQDGCFMGYKYVYKKEDGTFVDSHTKTIPNNVGDTPSMPREECDSNPNETCSRGLHVAAMEYVKGNSYVISVKVNPADVVAIPIDYNGQKMRVCKYEVMEVLKDSTKDLSPMRDDFQPNCNSSDDIEDENYDDDDDDGCPDCGEDYLDCCCDEEDYEEDEDYDEEDDDWDDNCCDCGYNLDSCDCDFDDEEEDVCPDCDCFLSDCDCDLCEGCNNEPYQCSCPIDPPARPKVDEPGMDFNFTIYTK